MGKMNALSLAEQEDLYEQYEESKREELREEGRKEVLGRIEYQLNKLHWQYLQALELEKANGVFLALQMIRSPNF
jgi:hypothetical protein